MKIYLYVLMDIIGKQPYNNVTNILLQQLTTAQTSPYPHNKKNHSLLHLGKRASPINIPIITKILLNKPHKYNRDNNIESDP